MSLVYKAYNLLHNINLMKKILVVDDILANLILIRKILKGTKYTCIEATSGKDALSILNNDPDIDLILLDVMMPEMSGYDVLKTLKQSEFLKHIPVIFVTASDFDNVTDYILALDDDAVSAIFKPFNFKSLLEKIDYFLWLFPESLGITTYNTQSQSS